MRVYDEDIQQLCRHLTDRIKDMGSLMTTHHLAGDPHHKISHVRRHGKSYCQGCGFKIVQGLS